MAFSHLVSNELGQSNAQVLRLFQTHDDQPQSHIQFPSLYTWATATEKAVYYTINPELLTGFPVVRAPDAPLLVGCARIATKRLEIWLDSFILSLDLVYIGFCYSISVSSAWDGSTANSCEKLNVLPVYSVQILPLLLFVCGGGNVKRSFAKRVISAIRGEQFYADMLRT